jgi:hypothetical protein
VRQRATPRLTVVKPVAMPPRKASTKPARVRRAAQA